LVSRVDIAKTKEIAVHELEAVAFSTLVVGVVKHLLQVDLLY
jgi:hypothetical protein